MSTDRVDAVKGIYERWSQGDFRAGPELFDERMMFVLPPPFPEPANYIGAEEIAEYMYGFLEPWEKVTIEAEEMVGAGDTVFVAVAQRAAGSGSGAMTELRYFQLWTFRGSRIIRLENFRERPDALAAAGLEGSEE